MLTRSKRRRLEEGEDPVVISSHYGLEREATIKRAKMELMALKVVDLRQELGVFGLTKSGGKADLVDRLAHHKWLLEGGSPFDWLPDEVMLKIVKMASWKRSETTICKGGQRWFSRYDHDFILRSISLVSARFNRIAGDGSMWKDVVTIESWMFMHYDVFMSNLVLRFLNDGTTKLLMTTRNFPFQLIAPHKIASIASKCPNLEILETSGGSIHSLDVEEIYNGCVPTISVIRDLSPYYPLN